MSVIILYNFQLISNQYISGNRMRDLYLLLNKLVVFSLLMLYIYRRIPCLDNHNQNVVRKV
mgnify:CR=1 FL=1